MKTNTNGILRIANPALLAMALLLSTTSLTGNEPNNDGAAAVVQNLEVQVDDLEGRISMESEWTRETLLREAFFDASKHHPWLQNPKFRYNVQTSNEEKASLSIKILRWKRSRNGPFEFAANAKYLDAEGQTHDLGMVKGSDTGIFVNTGRDAGDAFARAAQDGFENLLRQIKKIIDTSKTSEGS